MAMSETIRVLDLQYVPMRYTARGLLKLCTTETKPNHSPNTNRNSNPTKPYF